MWLKWTLTRLHLYTWISYLIIYISCLSCRKVDPPVCTFVKCIKLVLVECLLIRTDTLNSMHVINMLPYCLAAYRECHFIQNVLKNEFFVVSQSASLHIYLPFWMLIKFGRINFGTCPSCKHSYYHPDNMTHCAGKYTRKILFQGFITF
jgi:hypothetical protein